MLTITIIKREDLNKFPDNLPLEQVTEGNLMLGARAALQRSNLFIVRQDDEFYVMKDSHNMYRGKFYQNLKVLSALISNYIQDEVPRR